MSLTGFPLSWIIRKPDPEDLTSPGWKLVKSVPYGKSKTLKTQYYEHPDFPEVWAQVTIGRRGKKPDTS